LYKKPQSKLILPNKSLPYFKYIISSAAIISQYWFMELIKQIPKKISIKAYKVWVVKYFLKIIIPVYLAAV
jgi:hypothetical protein